MWLTEWDYIITYTAFMDDAAIEYIDGLDSFEKALDEEGVALGNDTGTLTLYQRKDSAVS